MKTYYLIDGINGTFETLEEVRRHIELLSDGDRRAEDGTPIIKVTDGESVGSWVRTIKVKGGKVVLSKDKPFFAH